MGSAVVLALLALAAATDGPSRAPTLFSETTQPSDDTIAGTLTMNIVPISGPGFDELDAVVARALHYCTSTNVAIADISAANDFADDADCYDTGVCPGRVGDEAELGLELARRRVFHARRPHASPRGRCP